MMLFFLIFLFVIVLVLAWMTIEYSFLIPPRKGLPILMYHKVNPGSPDGLTVRLTDFEQQLEYLSVKGYHYLSFADINKYYEKGNKLPEHPVILTFDDAYEDFPAYVFPLLKKFNCKATVFIPVGHIGKTNAWDNGNDRIMSVSQLSDLAKNDRIEFGIHSFDHRNYGDLTLKEMDEDLDKCLRTLQSLGLPFFPVLAYPYGGYPKKDEVKKCRMKTLFREKRINFALRIGNRINGWPLVDDYETKRIDIRGTDSFFTFKTKLKKGRAKLFS